MRTHFRWLSVIAVSVFCCATAFAACDISISDLKASEYSKQHDSVKQLMLIQMSRMTYSQAKDTYGVSVIYNGIPITGSAEQFQQFQESISNSQYTNTLIKHDSEIVRSFGDRLLVDAYIACLAAQGGISAQFSELSPLRAQLKINYYKPAGGKESAYIQKMKPLQDQPGVTVEMNGCSEGDAIESANGCIIDLRFDSADRDIAFSMQTDAGPATAYLPPRITLEKTSKDIPQDYIDAANKRVSIIVANAEGGNITGNLACTAALPEGYRILVNKAAGLPKVVVAFHPQYQPRINNPYLLGRLETADGAQRQVCFLTQCGSADGRFTACTGKLSGEMQTMSWVPKE